jgi:hypothetical protein
MPLMISVQDFAFRGRLVSLLGFACGVSPNTLFPQESSSCTPINRWNKLDIELTVKQNQKIPNLFDLKMQISLGFP